MTSLLNRDTTEEDRSDREDPITIDIGPPTARSDSSPSFAATRSLRENEDDANDPNSAQSLGHSALSAASLAALSSPSSSASLAGVRRDPVTGKIIGKNGKQIDPINVYDRKIHCPEYLFEDKVVAPLFKNILQKYTVAYFRPCVLRRTATGSVDNHVVRCVYIDAAKQQVQFVEENGQAKRAFNIQDIALIAVEKPAKSILGVALAPTMGIVLKSSPAIQGSKLAAEAHRRAQKRAAEEAAKAEKRRKEEEKKAAKGGNKPRSRAEAPTLSPRGGGGSANDGDPNDMVLRFEPFPPAKPAKGAPSPTSEQIRAARAQSQQDATSQMNDFITLLKHFNPYIVTRNALPHGIIGRMPLQLSKPPGKPDPPPGPPEVLKSEPTEAELGPPEEEITEEEEEEEAEEENEEEEEEEESAEEEEELEIDEGPPPPPVVSPPPRAKVVQTPPPPPPAPARAPTPEVQIEYEPPPALDASDALVPAVKFEFSTRAHEEYLDERLYPKFPNYDADTMLWHLFVDSFPYDNRAKCEGSETKKEEEEDEAARIFHPFVEKNTENPGATEHSHSVAGNIEVVKKGDAEVKEEHALYDPITDPLSGPPLLVSKAVPAFPIAFDTTFMGDDEASRCTAVTGLASEVLRCVQSHFEKEKRKARDKRREEARLRKARLAEEAGLQLPIAAGSRDLYGYHDDFVDPYYDHFAFNSDEDDDDDEDGYSVGRDPLAKYLSGGNSNGTRGVGGKEKGGEKLSRATNLEHFGQALDYKDFAVGGRSVRGGGALERRDGDPRALLPLPTRVEPADPREVYNGLQSPYEREDAFLYDDLAQRKAFIEGQLETIENKVLPSLIERRRRADALLEEMAESARNRGGQPLGPTMRLAGPDYERHMNLAVIIFDICRVRRQRVAYEAAMEGERSAGVVPSAYKHPLGLREGKEGPPYGWL